MKKTTSKSAPRKAPAKKTDETLLFPETAAPDRVLAPKGWYVGTSGYGYKEWKGSFYPKDIAASGMLRYYGDRFNTVEINNTFYRMPTPATVQPWTTEVPAGFKFVLKAPKQVTHILRLKNAAEAVSIFLGAAETLKEQLGALLFQLPPNFKKDVPRLRDFLALIPPTHRAALEFRNATWFDDEVYGVLRDRRAALCIAEADDDLEVPFVATTDWGYLRLRCADYNDAELKERLKRVADQMWRETFVFFKHEDEGKGPAMAKRFLQLAAG